MKKFLKIALLVSLPFLLVIAFCCYHVCRAIALDPGFNLWGDEPGGAESALDMVIFSKDLPQGVTCGELSSHLKAENFEPKEYLEMGSAADYLIRTHDESGKRTGYELLQRYEKDSLDGKFRLMWGEGSVITQYSKKDSCFRVSKEIKAETADSVVFLKTDFSGDSSLYVGKRKNGVVTECFACKWRDGHCDELISKNKMEFDSVSGKLLRYTSKTRLTYVEGSLHEDDNFYEDKVLFDSLHRPVQYEYNGHVFRYEYSSNDTADYKVNVYSELGRKVGFYKRKLKKNQETVKYGTNRYETEINRYYEKEKLIKETSGTIWFYNYVTFRKKLFDSAGNEVLDSASYEETFFPGMRYESNSFIVKHEYDENGKLKSYGQFQESYWRVFPFFFIPVNLESRAEVGKLEFDYDEAGRLKSITDASEDDNQALRNRFPFAKQRIVYSNENLENFKECKESDNP